LQGGRHEDWLFLGIAIKARKPIAGQLWPMRKDLASDAALQQNAKLNSCMASPFKEPGKVVKVVH
jgi:hypothetical protein